MGRNVQTYILKQKGNFIIGEIDWGPHQDHIAAGTAGSAGMACLHFVVQSGKQLRPLRKVMSAVVAETDQHPPRSGQQRGTFLCEPEKEAQFIMGLGHQTGGISRISRSAIFWCSAL